MIDLSLNKEQVKSFLETAIYGCLLVDGSGKIINANQNALTMLGYPDDNKIFDSHDKCFTTIVSKKVQKILVVDDDEMIRDIMRTTLSIAGYSVLDAENGKDALEKIKKEDVSIVVTDITMPEMNGDTMAREALKIKRGLKFIFVTGYDLKSFDLPQGIAVKIIMKPYKPEQLIEAVKEISAKE